MLYESSSRFPFSFTEFKATSAELYLRPSCITTMSRHIRVENDTHKHINKRKRCVIFDYEKRSTSWDKKRKNRQANVFLRYSSTTVFEATAFCPTLNQANNIQGIIHKTSKKPWQQTKLYFSQQYGSTQGQREFLAGVYWFLTKHHYPPTSTISFSAWVDIDI